VCSSDLLADLGDYGLWSALFADSASNTAPLPGVFTGVEELINQILLKTNVTGQQLANETSEKRILIVEHPHHLFALT